MRGRGSSFYWEGVFLDFTRYYVLHVDKSMGHPRYTLLDMGDNSWLQYSEQASEHGLSVSEPEEDEGGDSEFGEFF